MSICAVCSIAELMSNANRKQLAEGRAGAAQLVNGGTASLSVDAT